jgi:hypothetical protein
MSFATRMHPDQGPGGYSKVTEEPLSGASTRRRSLNVL